MQEIWKKVHIEPFSEYYEVSNLGRVRSLDREVCACNCRKAYKVNGTVLKQKINKSGYLYVHLSANGKCKSFRVHRLVALAFVKNPMPNEYDVINHKINHKDENKTNNVFPIWNGVRLLTTVLTGQPKSDFLNSTKHLLLLIGME